MKVVIKLSKGLLDVYFPFRSRGLAEELLKQLGCVPSGFQKDVWIFGEAPNAVPIKVIELSKPDDLVEVLTSSKS